MARTTNSSYCCVDSAGRAIMGNGGCDLILVEGDTQTTAPKIEVWQPAFGGPPMNSKNELNVAIISDDDPDGEA